MVVYFTTMQLVFNNEVILSWRRGYNGTWTFPCSFTVVPFIAHSIDFSGKSSSSAWFSHYYYNPTISDVFISCDDNYITTAIAIGY